jgi:FlaG/FlaF family flagellin (archaellin)
MNKKILTILVILATIISVVFILYPSNPKKTTEQSVQVKNNTSKKQVADKANNENNTSVKNDKLQKENKADDKGKAENSDPLIKVESNEYEDSYIDNSKNNYNKPDKKEEEALTASMIFKVDKNTIEKKISVSNKAKLLYYASKLSNFDYAQIKDILDNGDEVDGAKDIVKILKNRLKASDYEEVKKILSPYIDIEKIENHISV